MKAPKATLRSYLNHPSPRVRCFADWALEHARWRPTRSVPRHWNAARHNVRCLRAELEATPNRRDR